MSTKINIRSPFFLSLTEPTQTFGIFDCDTALLSNFAVRSSGFIDNPLPSKGVILTQSDFSFPANSGSAVIPRSVTYTIVIPANYTNSSDITIPCVKTFDQPFQTAQENPSDNSTCPTVNTQPSNLSGITAGAAQVIDVDTLFTAGSEAIGTYNVKRISGSSSITAVISGTGTNVICTIESSTACVTGQFLFQAINTSGSCEALTNAFSFSTAGCQAFDCDDPDFIADSGKIFQDGTVKKSVYQLGGLSLNKLLYGSTDISTSLTVGPNNTGSVKPIVLTYRFNIPSGFTNSGTLDCDISYEQDAIQVDPTYSCSDAILTGGSIEKDGTFILPEIRGFGTYYDIIYDGTSYFPFSPINLGENTSGSGLPKTITYKLNIPDGYSNTGVFACVPITYTQLSSKAFDCNVANINGTIIYKDGAVNIGSFAEGTLNALLYDGNDIQTSLNAGANNTGSQVPKTLIYRFNIPSGYSNSGTFDCPIIYDQKSNKLLPLFQCADANIDPPFISDQGSIQNPTVRVKLGTYVSHSPAGFQTVTTQTPRIITFTVTAPSSEFRNSGENITCDVPVLQPALIPVVGTTGLYLSRGFASVDDICKLQRPGEFFETFTEAKTTASSFAEAKGSFTQIVTVGGSVLQGNGQIFVITPTQQKVDGTVIFSFLKIEGGVVQATGKHICTYDGGFL